MVGNKKIATIETSLDNLLVELKKAVYMTHGNDSARYARAFGYLETEVKKHLIKSTNLSMKDIQDFLITNTDY